MALIGRRLVLAAGGTLAAGLCARKPLADGLKPLSAALRLREPPAESPDFAFADAGGGEHRLAEFHGRGMVINFWATWCAPCVEEMPSLATLSTRLAPDDIAVLPLSSDRGGVPVVQAFYEKIAVRSLPVLLDPRGAAAHAFNARGLPTSVLIDRQGLVRATVEGAADWSSAEAYEQVRKLVSG